MSQFTNENVVTGAVDVNNFPVSQPVTGPLTDTELRADAVVVVAPDTAPVFIAATTAIPVSGAVDAQITNFPATQLVSGPLTDTELRATPVPISGAVSTTPLSASSSTITQITSTGSNQTLLAANTNRKKVILYFNSGIWDIKLGAVASTTSRTYHVSSSNTVIEIDTWVGIIDVICTTAGKLVDVTELS